MTKTNKKGFTIIEVVLVLAIAGLIFLMVFIALPALQRSQRNTRRRQDMARILSAFNDYSSNNNGKLPYTTKGATTGGSSPDETLKAFMDRYVGANGSDERKDPDGTQYTLKYVGEIGKEGLVAGKSEALDTNKFNHIIYFYTKAACDNGTEGKVKAGKGARELAIFYYLEGGAIYCGDNS